MLCATPHLVHRGIAHMTPTCNYMQHPARLILHNTPHNISL